MIECIIPCRIANSQIKEIENALESFTEDIAHFGFKASISYSDVEKDNNAFITLSVDDEMIQAMKGAKRGPKEKVTNISIDEMLEMKASGCPPKEIAAAAGISVATYFRRMAAYKAQTNLQSQLVENGVDRK